MSDDLVEKVIDAMSNCGSETVGSRMARAAIAVVLEEAAKVADGVGQQPPTDNLMHDTGWDGASLVIAAAIRALKGTK